MSLLTRLRAHFTKPHTEPSVPKAAPQRVRHKSPNAQGVEPLQKHTIATAAAEAARVSRANADGFEAMQHALDRGMHHLSEGEHEKGELELQNAVAALGPVKAQIRKGRDLAARLRGAYLQEALPKMPLSKLLALDKHLRCPEHLSDDMKAVVCEIQFAVKAELLRLKLNVPLKPRPEVLQNQGLTVEPSDWRSLPQETLIQVEELVVKLWEMSRHHPSSSSVLSGTQFTRNDLRDLATRARNAVLDSDVAVVSKEPDPNKKLAMLLQTVQLFAAADLNVARLGDAPLDTRALDSCIAQFCSTELSKARMSALQVAEKALTQWMSSSPAPQLLYLLLAVKAQLLRRNLAAIDEKRGVALKGITETEALKLKKSTLPKLQKRAAELIGFAQRNSALKELLGLMGYTLKDLKNIESLASAATKVRAKASLDAVEQEGKEKPVHGPADDEVNMDDLLEIQARISDMPELPSVPGGMQAVFETLQNVVANRNSIGGGEPVGEQFALQDVEDLLSQSLGSRVAQAQAMLQDASPAQMSDVDLDALEDAVILPGLSEVPAPNLDVDVAGRLVKARIELRDALQAAKAEADNSKKLEQLLVAVEAARVVVDVAGKASWEVEELHVDIDVYSAAGLHMAKTTVLVAAEKRLDLMALASPNDLSIRFLSVAVKSQLIDRAVRGMPKRYGVQLHEITKDNVLTLQKSMLNKLRKRTGELMRVIESDPNPTDVQGIRGAIATLQTLKTQAEDAIKLFPPKASATSS